jgi:hypothetical protein
MIVNAHAVDRAARVRAEEAILRRLLSNDTSGTHTYQQRVHNGGMYRQSLLRIHAICSPVRGSFNVALPVYMLVYAWAMKADHIGVLEILADLEFFDNITSEPATRADEDFLNDGDGLHILKIAVRKGNLEALAFTLNRVHRGDTTMRENTIDALLSIVDDILRVHNAIGICGTIFGVGSVDSIRAIEAMFLILKKICYEDSHDKSPTINELRPIKRNPDAMVLFLNSAVSTIPVSHQTVINLLQAGIYTRDELQAAVDIMPTPVHPWSVYPPTYPKTVAILQAAMPSIPSRRSFRSHAALAQRRLTGLT